MKLLILALIVLITWELYDRVKEKLPEWVETIKDWLGIESPSKVYMDACHAARGYSPFMDTSEARRKANNKQRFLRGLEDFCHSKGLDLKVWEDFEFDALGMRLHDRKTNRVMQARVKREDYEKIPEVCVIRIMSAWLGGKHEETEATD